MWENNGKTGFTMGQIGHQFHKIRRPYHKINQIDIFLIVFFLMWQYYRPPKGELNFYFYIVMLSYLTKLKLSLYIRLTFDTIKNYFLFRIL